MPLRPLSRPRVRLRSGRLRRPCDFQRSEDPALRRPRLLLGDHAAPLAVAVAEAGLLERLLVLVAVPHRDVHHGGDHVVPRRRLRGAGGPRLEQRRALRLEGVEPDLLLLDPRLLRLIGLALDLAGADDNRADAPRQSADERSLVDARRASGGDDGGRVAAEQKT